VYSKGDSNRDIYFVMDGEVGAFIIANNVLKEIRSFYSLQGFGDAEAITQTNRMFATIAKKQSLVAILKPNDFSDVLRDYNARVYQLRLGKFAANYILKGLNKSQLELVVHNAVEVRMSRNQVIYESGQPSEEMYLIEKGEVRLFNDVNRKQIEICELEDGELLGETEMILDHTRISSAICISDTLLLYKISKKLFLSQANEHLLNSLYQPLQEKETQRL
jgi:CRP-like cAMP-binding protein